MGTYQERSTKVKHKTWKDHKIRAGNRDRTTLKHGDIGLRTPPGKNIKIN